MHLLLDSISPPSLSEPPKTLGLISPEEQLQVDAALQLDLPIVLSEPIPVLYIEMTVPGCRS